MPPIPPRSDLRTATPASQTVVGSFILLPAVCRAWLLVLVLRLSPRGCWCCVCRAGAGAASFAAWVLVLVLGASFGGPRAGDGGVVCRAGCVVYVVRVAEEDGPRVRHGQLHSFLRECVVCQMQHQHPVSTSGKRQQVPGGAM